MLKSYPLHSNFKYHSYQLTNILLHALHWPNVFINFPKKFQKLNQRRFKERYLESEECFINTKRKGRKKRKENAED